MDVDVKRSDGELPYRLLFLDIDGTLVGREGQMSDRVRAAVERCRLAGCVLVLCTGRSRFASQKISEQVGGEGISIVLNGALAFNWKTGKVLRRALIPFGVARQAIETAHAMQIAPIWLGAEEQSSRVYTDRRCPLWPQYEARNLERIVFLDYLARDMPGMPASIAAYGSQEMAERLAGVWRAQFGERAVCVAGPTSIYDSWYAQLTDRSADKGRAAKAVAEALCIPRERVLAIGDHQNDTQLLQWAGLGVCMGDGDPAAIAAADFVTSSLADDGAASALERFVLASRPAAIGTVET